MSGNQPGGPWYPPPGHQEQQTPPGYAAPPGAVGYPSPGAAGYPPPQGAPYPGQQYPPPQWPPPPGMLGAAHKPGAMPLRPLGLGDIYDAAFRIIRFNPKATVGSAVLVAAVAMAVPVVVTALLTWTVGMTYDNPSADVTQAEGVAALTSFGSLALGLLLQGVGTILVTGMIARVTAAAAVGQRLSLGAAWAETRGRRWRLVGLTFLLAVGWTVLVGLYVLLWAVVLATGDVTTAVVFGLLSLPAFVVLACWLWVRLAYLPVPALMLEEIGVFAAVGRAYRLTARQFWRTFGIALLTFVIVAVAGQVLSVPISLIGQVVALSLGPEYQLLGLIVVQAMSTTVVAAFVTPFQTAVASVQYLDQRMRKEAYDVELMAQAGITAS
jgi:MFS family permease